ncbi:MAG: hypothetical protein IPO92_24230 [Saprospiraceae bacterium]|nr:hypothetical protein [Saprospiraceae bacterium]
MKHVLLSFFILLCGVSMTFGPTMVSGKVTDSAGDPLIGANVVAKIQMR